jgi:hypothetical protein
VTQNTRPVLGGQPAERLGVGERGGERLVAHHVEAALEEGARRRGVQVVGRDHAHEVEPLAVGPRGLGVGHALVAVVRARRVEAEEAALRARPLGGRGEGAGREHREPVERRRPPVHRADEGPGAAAHHAVAERRAELFACVGHRGRSSGFGGTGGRRRGHNLTTPGESALGADVRRRHPPPTPGLDARPQRSARPTVEPSTPRG